MKYILLFIACFGFYVASAQVAVERAPSTVQVMDSYLKAHRMLSIPVYVDTTAANTYKGLDSLGALIWCTTARQFWIRDSISGARKWTNVLLQGSDSSIYNTDGILQANRNVHGNGKILTIDSTNYIYLNGVSGGNTSFMYIRPGVQVDAEYQTASGVSQMTLTNITALIGAHNGSFSSYFQVKPDSINAHQSSGYYVFDNPASSADTTTFKPVGQNINGLIKRMTYWPGSGGGGGGTTFTRQSITSGSSGTVTGGNYIVTFNPASVLASYNLTLPTSPSDMDIVKIEAGGTITGGNPVVTALTITGTKMEAVTVTTINAGEYIEYQYRTSNTTWYRHQ